MTDETTSMVIHFPSMKSYLKEEVPGEEKTNGREQEENVKPSRGEGPEDMTHSTPSLSKDRTLHDLSQNELTSYLKRWSEGDSEALDEVIALTYDELHRIAEIRFLGERADHSLQPTALVGHLYEQLKNRRQVSWQNRAQFFGFASEVMRRVLVDHARRHKAQKRGGDVVFATLDEALDRAEAQNVSLLDLDEALEALGRTDPQGQRVVVMRYFGGMSHQEIADATNLSKTTVRRRWTTARLWLRRELRSP